MASPGVRLGSKVEEVWGKEVPQRDTGPARSGGFAPEAEKHDINFALRITLVNAYYPLYSSYIS